jgi:hypothetical protein
MDFKIQKGEPLFPQTLWTRPVSRDRAGRLLLIGGHAGDFSFIQNIYLAAEAAGAGHCLVILPDSLRKVLGHVPSVHYVASSPSGSLGRAAVGEILNLVGDFDAVTIGGNLSSNSETAMTIESVLSKLSMPIVLYDDVLEIMRFNLGLITGPSRLIILTVPQIVQLANGLKIPIKMPSDQGVVAKVNLLKQLTDQTEASYLVYGSELIAAVKGQISVTPVANPAGPVPSLLYGAAAVFWLQNQSKPFEGLTSAAYTIARQVETAGSKSVRDQIASIRQVISQSNW